MPSSTPAPAAKQPTMAELQAQMAAQKKAAAPVVVEEKPTPVTVKEEKVESPAPVVKEKEVAAPAPTPVVVEEKSAPAPAPVAEAATLPQDIVNLIEEDGMVVSASGRVANAQWGGVAYFNDKTVITLFIPKSRPAHAMLTGDDKFTITVGGVKYHVIECRKVSATPMEGNVTMFIGEVVKVETR